MKLKELDVKAKRLYLNLKDGDIISTCSMPTEEAINKYGDLEVIKYIPYEEHHRGILEETSDEWETSNNSYRGMDSCILKVK